nr:hypothetical transcript [Hymenolepis microstoma]
MILFLPLSLEAFSVLCLSQSRLWLQQISINMLIKVKTLVGKEIEIDIDQTDRIERIKERIEEKEGIPPPQQRLIFSEVVKCFNLCVFIAYFL